VGGIYGHKGQTQYQETQTERRQETKGKRTRRKEILKVNDLIAAMIPL